MAKQTKTENKLKKTVKLLKKPKKIIPAIPVEYKKLVLYFVIVNANQGESVVKLFQQLGSSLQIRHLGVGTATKQVLDVLGVEDNKKEVVVSIIPEEKVEDAVSELEAFFAASKKNRGVGFSISLTSMVGVKLYHFLTNTL